MLLQASVSSNVPSTVHVNHKGYFLFLGSKGLALTPISNYSLFMQVPKVFAEHVAMKYRLYAGLFNDLPYDLIREAGATLPLFAQYCREGLERGDSPDAIVEGFFARRLELKDFAAIRDRLFVYLRLTERQVVLFDAVEDASFSQTRDIDGNGSLSDVLGRVHEHGLDTRLHELLDRFGVRIVLTAHPTQFYTEPVLGIIAELRDAIQHNDVGQVHRLLLQLGRTRFKKKEQPTPFDEAKAILWFMEHVLYKVVPDVHRRVVEAAQADSFARLNVRPVADLGFWPGGDRDGNPNVTVETTLRVGALLHDSIVRLYIEHVARLRERLSFDGVLEGLSAVQERLESRLHPVASGRPFCDANELFNALVTIRHTLVNNYEALFVEDLDELIYAVRCFGFYFASLDLRQDSRIIAKAVDEVLSVLSPADKGFTNLTQEERINVLSRQNEALLTGKLGTVLSSVQDAVVRDTLEVFSAAHTIQAHNGEQGIHRFIISNTQGPADVLSVRFLAICAGWNPAELNLDIVPLFETVDDLDSARATMDRLWSLPVYRAHIKRRNDMQHIMLGFSDGTKDGGYLTANWFIYRAKQDLSDQARSAGVQVVFFDGRGGPPARGGGKTHAFYRSLGRDIESRTIHLTVQGQTISSMFGNLDSARFNLEQLVSAVLDNNLFPHNEDWHLDHVEAKLLDDLSDLAHAKYRELRDHPQFLAFLEELSPLRYYAQANISSRPSKRPGARGGLTLADLRAIPFVGSWSQLKLNVPGFYGLGTALEALDRAGRLDELVRLHEGSLYFRTLTENSMQSLSKVYLPLTTWMERDERFASFRKLLGEEIERTIAYLKLVAGQDELLGQDPINRASIRVREDMTLPVSLIQQYAIGQIRRLTDKSRASTGVNTLQPTSDDVPTLEKIVIKSMATCVNASRNSV